MESEERLGAPLEMWAIIELMGRKKLAGHVTEVTIAGAGFLRIDVPEAEGHAACTQFVRPETIYALTPTTEELARRVARNYRPEPVHAFEVREPEKARSLPSYRDDEEEERYDRDEDDRD